MKHTYTIRLNINSVECTKKHRFIKKKKKNDFVLIMSEIRYTDKFDILTFFLETNSVVVSSPDCIWLFAEINI